MDKLLEDEDEKKIELKKTISLFDAVLLIIGSIIGTGIFISPVGVIRHTGTVPAAICVWIICGILSVMGSLCYAELGTLFPTSGGPYVYIKEVFGSLPAFVYLWASLIGPPASKSASAIAFAHYIIKPFYLNCDPPKISVILLSLLLLLLLAFINCVSVKWSLRLNNSLSLTKIAALVIIIIAGMCSLVLSKASMLNVSFEGPMNIGSFSLAIYSGLWTYSGWAHINAVTEEIRNPKRNLPLSIMIAIPVVTFIYVMTNISYFSVISTTEIMSSEAVAVTFGQKVLGDLWYSMPVFVALSIFGALITSVFSTARIYYAGSRDGLLPASLSFLHSRNFTPLPAILLTCCLSVLLILTNSDIHELSNYYVVADILSQIACIGSLLRRRGTKPQAARGIKVNIALPIIYMFCCFLLIVVPILTKPSVIGMGVLIVSSGIPVYFVMQYLGRLKPSSKFFKVKRSWELLIMKFCSVLPAELHKEL